GVVASDLGRHVAIAHDLLAVAHQVAHRLAGGLRDALGERAAVGVRIDGYHPVVTRVGEGHAEQRRHGRLADAALAAHDGDEAGTTVDPGTDAGLHGIALARGLTVAEVDEPAGHGVEDAAPGINGRRLADRAGLEQAVVGEHGALLTGSGRLGLAGTACMRFDERRTLRAGDLL